MFIPGRAKTTSILFTEALASKLHTRHVDSVSLDPGCESCPIRRSQHHPDGIVAIKTNLQVYMTPEMREEGIQTIETNTGRKYIHSFGLFSSPSTWGRRMMSNLSLCKVHSPLVSSRPLNKDVQQPSSQHWIQHFHPEVSWETAS